MWMIALKENFSDVIKGILFYFPAYFIFQFIIEFFAKHILDTGPMQHPFIFGILMAFIAWGLLCASYRESKDTASNVVSFFRALVIVPIWACMLYGDLHPDFQNATFIEQVIMYFFPPTVEGVIEEGLCLGATALCLIVSFLGTIRDGIAGAAVRLTRSSEENQQNDHE